MVSVISPETGLKYQSRGYRVRHKATFEGPDESSTWLSTGTLKFNYVDLPIVLNIAFTKGDVRVYARTGIYVGVLATGNYSERYEYLSSYGESSSSEFSQQFTGMDMEDRITGGIILGAGVEYKNFFFETNYNLGAFSLANLDSEMYTHDLSLSLGYKLKFKK